VKAKGDRAEDAVVDYLVTRGFEILARNVRLGALEIDVVARRDELAAVVEVRTRGVGAFTRGLESVDAKKRARLVRATERLWRQKLSKLPGIERVRIDVASVTFEGAETHVEYIEAAFTG
jgi:putative endonuclease